MWRRVSSRAAVPVFAALSPAKEEKAFLWPETFTRPAVVPNNERAKVALAATVA